MDAKEVKASLKSAREAIRNKDYMEALKLCRAVLKQDKGNYNALVFIGVAAEGLDQADQAIMAYTKATEAEPTQLLAWQGLCGFYEKADKVEYRKHLAEVYQNLISLFTSDKAKQYDVSFKLAKLQQLLGNHEKAMVVYQELLDLCEDAERKLEVYEKIVSYLRSLAELSDDQTSMLVESYRAVLAVAEKQKEEELWAGFLQTLIKSGEMLASIIEVCQQFATYCPMAVYPLEVLCQVHLDTLLTGCADEGLDIAPTLDQLEQRDGGSLWTTLVKLHASLQARDVVLAKGLSQGMAVSSLKESVSGLLLRAETLVLTHASTEVNSVVSLGLKQLGKSTVSFHGDRDKASRRFTLCRASGYIASGTESLRTQAVDICEKLLEENPGDVSVLYHLARAHLGLGRADDAQTVLQQARSAGVKVTAELLSLEGQLHLLKGQLETAEQLLQESVNMDDTSASAHFNLGRVHWQHAQTTAQHPDAGQKCFTSLLKAAKLDPFFSPVFLHLGHYYLQLLHDKVKARRCYEKAYELDSDNVEAGAAMIDLLMAQGEEEKAIKVLESVTSQASAGSAKWAWLRQGLHQLKHNSPVAAIGSLQSALRADPKDVHCWECLGEAYMNRGSYTAALKAFTRATELDASAMYCYYQIASIKQSIGLYDEAVTGYKQILQQSPDYVPALKGVGETYLLMAKAALRDFLHGRAVGYCQAALQHLTRSAGSRPDLSCLWKLMGDACTILAPVPDSKISLQVPGKLLSQQIETAAASEESVDKKELLALGGRCYGMAIKLQPDCASLWHDLGVNYFHQVKVVNKVNVRSMASKSVQCLQKAATLAPSNHAHWNALGVVALLKEVDHPALAQHCFIKSVETEANNVAAWTNLGTLYLKHSQIKLAHEAFKVAQSLDPGYVACWIGQALIAETVGDADTMDLFRHTTELANHAESGLGYAHWVCATLQDKTRLSADVYRYAIEQMAAVPAASDALAKYTDRVQDDHTAFNMYGLLLEKQGLLREAVQMYQRAVRLLEKTNQKDEAVTARTNYARLLCATGSAEAAVREYQSLAGLGTCEVLCGRALALYKAGQLDDCLHAYGEALGAAKTEGDTSHINAAIGMVHYKLGDVGAAKSALFKCSQASCPSVPGLQALFSLGLLQQDTTLAEAVSQELLRLGDLGDDSITVDYLQATLSALQGDAVKGRNRLLRAVHLNPTRTRLWDVLAQYLLQHCPLSAEAAVACAHRGHSSSSSSSADGNAALALGLASLAAGRHARTEAKNNAFYAAQKAVHLHPDKLRAWCSLLSAVHAEHVVRDCYSKPNDLHGVAITMAAHLMAKVEAELTHEEGSKEPMQALHLWCVKQYVIALMSAERLPQAQQFLQQATWLYENDTNLQSLLSVFNQNLAGLKTIAQGDPSGCAYQWLVSLYISRGLLQEAETCYRQWAEQASTKSQKMLAIVQLAHFAYKNILASGSEEGSDRWRSLFTEACSEALRLDSQCVPVHFLQGIVAVRDKNQKATKREFLHVVKRSAQGGSLPTATREAQKHLLKYFQDKKDEESLQALLNEARTSGDVESLDYFDQFLDNTAKIEQ